MDSKFVALEFFNKPVNMDFIN